MYNDIREFIVISRTAVMMNDLHLSLYATQNESGDVRYSLAKKNQHWSQQKLQNLCSSKKKYFTIFFK